MKHNKDIGLDHVIKLGIRGAKNGTELLKIFEKKYGREKAHELLQEFMDACDEKLEARYVLKNSEYDLAMMCSGAFDADIIRKACNWVDKNKDFFGESILEVGCDCGFMTTFLGTIFPNKKITAIDRYESGIAVAKTNVEKFGLTNVEFVCDDVMNLHGKKFDTVFSMRTMQENSCAPFEEDIVEELYEVAEKYSTDKGEYASTLAMLTNDNGTLISIERTSRDALFFGWIDSLVENGFSVNIDSYEELVCDEIGNKTTLEAVVFNKKSSSDISADQFLDCCMKYIDIESVSYQGWDAKIMYAYEGGELIKGFLIEDTTNGAKTKIIICKSVMVDAVMLYQNNCGNATLEYCSTDDMDQLVNQIEEEIESVKKNGYISVTDIRYKDDVHHNEEESLNE